MLNFIEQTGSIALIMIWPFPVKDTQTQYTKQSKAQQSRAKQIIHRLDTPPPPHTHRRNSTCDSIKVPHCSTNHAWQYVTFMSRLKSVFPLSFGRQYYTQGPIVLPRIMTFRAKDHAGVEPMKLFGMTLHCHYISQFCKSLAENDSPYFTSYIVYTQKTRQT